VKIPPRVLKCLAGPFLASAALACSSPPPYGPITPIAPVTPTVVATQAEALDPVSYDASAEAERHARMDVVVASSELAQQERIEAKEASERRRARAERSAAVRFDHVRAACGRG